MLLMLQNLRPLVNITINTPVCYNIVCIKCLRGFINLFMPSIGLQHELKEQALVVLGTDNKEQMVASVVRLSTQSRDGTVTVKERC